MKIIGLTGNPGAGKDSTAAALALHGFRSMAFADALRVEICRAFSMPLHELTERAFKERPTLKLAWANCEDYHFRALMMQRADRFAPVSPREVMRLWGTEYRRAQDPNYWTAQMSARIRDFMREGLARGEPRLVLTDVRFRNEADMLRTWGAEIWRVHRVESLANASAHASDIELADYPVDRDVHNDGSLQDLANEVTRLLQAAGFQAVA